MTILKSLLFATCMFAFSSTNAQFWKKVKDAVREGVEEAVENQTEKVMDRKNAKRSDKAAEQSDSDNIFDKTGKDGSLFGDMLGGNTAPPQSVYTFDYRYVIKYTDEKNTTSIPYLLKSGADYFASTNPENTKEKEDVITVFDQNTKTTHVFRRKGNEKTRVSMKLDFGKLADQASEDAELNVTPLNTTKTILGHNCKGYRVNGKTIDDNVMESTIWIYNPPVSFGIETASMMKNKKFGNVNSEFFNMKGLVMEMDTYTYQLDNKGRKKKEHRSSFTCTEYKKTSVTVKSDEYRSMF